MQTVRYVSLSLSLLLFLSLWETNCYIRFPIISVRAVDTSNAPRRVRVWVNAPSTIASQLQE